MKDNEPYDLNLYYQMNSYDDIQDDKLKDIKNTNYYLIEAKNINPLNFSFELIINLLKDDGVDLSMIKEYKYLIEEKKNDKTNIILKPLSDTIISQVTYLNNLYLHLIIGEDSDLSDESSGNENFDKEIDDYKEEIIKAEQKFEEITSCIKKNEFNSDKNIIDFSLKNVEKNVKQNVPESNQNIISKSEIQSDEKYIEKLDNADNINNDNCDNNNNNIIFQRSLNMEKTEKKDILLSYLYSNPLLNSDHKKIYEDNDCFNEIVTIYNIFKESKQSANLFFEPINNNFNEYESSPDIIHIKVNSSFTKEKLFIHLDYLGDLQYYKCEELKTRLNLEYDLSQVKLLILSTQNIKKMNPIFKTIGIKNIIYIENQINYPEPNEPEEEFIKKLYQNMIIKGLSIRESFQKSKFKLNEKITVELYQESDKDIYIVQENKDKKDKKENKDNKENKNTKGKIETKDKKETIDKKDNKKNIIKINNNCSLNLDFVKYNYKRIIGRNVELKNCIDKLVSQCNVCVCGYPGAGKKSFIQTIGKFVYERNMFNEVKYIEIYYLRNAEETLKNKKDEIKSHINDNQLENNMTKILLIINADFIITDENDAFILEEYINRIKDKQFTYLYAFTINRKFSFAQIKNKLRRTPMIELDKLQQEKRMNLYYSISHNLRTKYNFKKQEAIIKKTNGYPNEIFLRTLYIKQFFQEIKNVDVDELTNEVIFKKIIEKYGKGVVKIFSIFTNYLEISEIVLEMYFEKEEISLIKNDLNFIIFCEQDEKGKNYSLDSSFKEIIKKVINDKYEKYS